MDGTLVKYVREIMGEKLWDLKSDERREIRETKRKLFEGRSGSKGK